MNPKDYRQLGIQRFHQLRVGLGQLANFFGLFNYKKRDVSLHSFWLQNRKPITLGVHR